MRKKHSIFKTLGTFVLAAGLSVGLLAASVQWTEAQTRYPVETVDYSKEYQLDDGSTYFAVKGTFLQINEESEAARKINAALKKEKNRLIREWNKMADSCKDENQSGYEYGDELTYKITANDANYFSVLFSGYEYTGGAHGLPYRSSMTFDAQTGEKLTAAKVFGITKKQLNKKVQKLYLKKYDKKGAEVGFYPGNDVEDGRKQLQDTLVQMDFNDDFYVKNGKAVFYVYPYTLGPYSAGFIQVSARIQ